MVKASLLWCSCDNTSVLLSYHSFHFSKLSGNLQIRQIDLVLEFVLLVRKKILSIIERWLQIITKWIKNICMHSLVKCQKSICLLMNPWFQSNVLLVDNNNRSGNLDLSLSKRANHNFTLMGEQQACPLIRRFRKLKRYCHITTWGFGNTSKMRKIGTLIFLIVYTTTQILGKFDKREQFSFSLRKKKNEK